MFLPIYKKIFNFIFEPDIWPIGSIKPIYKNKGNHLDPKSLSNYKLYNTSYVVFANYVCYFIRLLQFSEEVIVFVRKTNSNLWNHSTTFSFFEILKSKKKNLFCAFLYFEKVFDKIWRKALRVVQTSIK